MQKIAGFYACEPAEGGLTLWHKLFFMITTKKLNEFNDALEYVGELTAAAGGSVFILIVIPDAMTTQAVCPVVVKGDPVLIGETLAKLENAMPPDAGKNFVKLMIDEYSKH